MILEDDTVSQADANIAPPNDSTCSDEDSGDENDGIVDNLSGNQLRATAEKSLLHTLMATKSESLAMRTAMIMTVKMTVTQNQVKMNCRRRQRKFVLQINLLNG